MSLETTQGLLERAEERLRAGDAGGAITLLREALRAEPGNLRGLDALSVALMVAGEHGEAEQIVRQALALGADLPLAHMRLGLALANQGKLADAVGSFEEAARRAPHVAAAQFNLGDVLIRLHRFPEAIAALRRAAALTPDDASTHNFLGIALHELGLHEGAVARFERAFTLDPSYAMARYNIGVARLFRQEFELAWSDYERWVECAPLRPGARKDLASLERYERLPRWRGPGEPGVTELAIWADQGIGDQVLHSTLLPELAGTGVPFLYEVDARLLPAYQRAFPRERFVSLADPPREELQRASRVLLAGSLPALFRRSRASFDRQPARVLRAAPARVEHYRRELAALGPGLKVAISWQSTRTDWLGARKNAPLAELAPLFQLRGVHFVDVQYGDTAAERGAAEAATGARLVRFGEVDYYHDLEEVLAILEACDLVIATSNATAHFAGALGKRTWLLYLAEHAPFHYWVHGGTYRSLWYPGVEIVTGMHLRDWRALAGAAAAKLAAELRGEAPAVGPVAMASAAPGGSGQLAHAKALRAQGKLAEAVAACRRAIEEHPGDAQAWSELAHGLRWQDDLNGARSAAARAIEIAPGLASAWFNLGAVQVEQGETAPGIESYRKALEIEPGFAEAWSNLGAALGAAGDHAGEIEAYLHAISVNPGLAPVWANLGNALLEAGDVDEAIAACRRAVEVDAGFVAGWNNLGSALLAKGEHEAAIEACEKALELAPQFAEAWGTLGAALHGGGRYEEALRAHHKALEGGGGNARLHVNLGVTLQHCGRSVEAIASFRRALALDPHHARAHWDLSFALLATGQFAEGWEEYEWRWRRPEAEAKRYDFAAWSGDISKPSRVLLWAEQGVGDQILYASMIPDLLSSPLRVTLEADPRLVPLFRRSFPGAAVVPQGLPHAKEHDCQLPLGSLPRRLRPSFASFPRHEGYLQADAARVREYRQRLLEGLPGETRLVGISWRSANREFGAHKSSALRDWVELLGVPRARFIDLQYGDTAAERAGVEQEAGVRVTHLPDLDLYGDLEGVAALAAACDLVITASNVTAHVAGALGRPVWLLVPEGNGRLWYWFAGRTDSPWYPSMRIHTRAQESSWRDLLGAVARELAVLVSRKP